MRIDTYTSDFHIRTITASDKPYYMSLRQQTSDLKRACEEYSQFFDYYWETMLKGGNEISMVVFTTDEPETFVAICSFQDFNGDHVDIGYDVVEGQRGKGIATRLTSNLVTMAHEYFPGKEVLIRVRTDNNASRRVVEKCGGALIKKEPTPEAKITMNMLAEYRNDEIRDNSLSEDRIDFMKNMIENGKEGVLVYRMP